MWGRQREEGVLRDGHAVKEDVCYLPCTQYTHVHILTRVLTYV